MSRGASRSRYRNSRIDDAVHWRQQHTTVQIEGLGSTLDESRREAQQRVIMPGYFGTLGVPLRAGRVFTDQDREGAPLVIVISEAMARRDWPNETAIGKRVKFQGEWRTVIGVVADIKFRTLASDVEPTVYAPFGQRKQGLTFLVRTRGEPAAMAPVIRAALTRVASLKSQSKRCHLGAALVLSSEFCRNDYCQFIHGMDVAEGAIEGAKRAAKNEGLDGLTTKSPI